MYKNYILIYGEGVTRLFLNRLLYLCHSGPASVRDKLLPATEGSPLVGNPSFEQRWILGSSPRMTSCVTHDGESKSVFINVLLVLFIAILVFGTYSPVLTFAPWIDDSKLLWTSLFNISEGAWYLNHPGLPLYFFIMSNIFGMSYVFWQIANLIIKIATACILGQFVFELTSSRKASLYSAIGFAVSFAGMEAISAPIMNVAALASVPLMLSFIAGIRFLKKQTVHSRHIFFFLLCACVIDPARCLFALPLLLYPFSLFSSLSFKTFWNKNILRWIVRICILMLPFAVLFFIYFVWPSQVMIGIRGLFTEPSVYIQKISRIQNMFASLGTQWIGFVYPMKQNAQNTGVFEQIFSLFGVLTVIMGFVCGFLYVKTKHVPYAVISIFLFWMILLYIPNWFSEPRAPMSTPHRYLYLTSLGWIACVGYVLSFFKRTYIALAVFIVFCFFHVLSARSILFRQSVFRDIGVVEKIWNAVDTEVPWTQERFLFVFDGADPWLTQSIELFGSYRFLLRRRVTDSSLAPVVTRDKHAIQAHVCSGQIPLTHVFAWNVGELGSLESTTHSIRLQIDRLCEETKFSVQ